MTGEFRPFYMAVRDRFGPVRKEAIPAAYVFGSQFSRVVDLMRRQGIAVRKTSAPWVGPASHFMVDSLTHTRFFEGHCGVLLEGAETFTYANGKPEWTMKFHLGQKVGDEVFYRVDGSKEWEKSYSGDGWIWRRFDGSGAVIAESKWKGKTLVEVVR